jgi:Domain of unknown function (DUF927)
MNKIVKPILRWAGICIDDASGDHFYVFETTKLTGGTGLDMLRADEADDLTKLRRALKQKGAVLPNDKASCDKLLRSSLQEEPSKIWHLPAQTGWQRDGDVFVIGGRAIGKAASGYRLAPWARTTTCFAKKGTIEGWQQRVAKPAQYSSVMMTLIAAAFTAPLLRQAGRLNFMLNLYGPSKSGKSTGLLAATSVFGIGNEQALPNWNATALAIQEAGETFNDLVLPINETGLIMGPKTKAYDSFIRPLIYAYAEGQPRKRSRAASLTDQRPASPWHGILISTAEQSFAALAEASGDKRNSGEVARCYEIPAVRKKRLTVFDRWPLDVKEAEREAWATEALRKLRTACTEHHGTAIRKFIRRLVGKGKADAAKFVAKHQVAFLEKLNIKDMPPELGYAAQNFALIYAGGALAIEAKVLPWRRKELLSAVLKCFRATESGKADLLRQAQKKLAKHLNSATVQRDDVSKSTSPTACEGYFDHGQGVFKIHAKAFRGWFSTSELNTALLWLHDQGHLTIPNTTKLKSGTGWAESTIGWPDRKTHRTIILRDPFSKIASMKSKK